MIETTKQAFEDVYFNPNISIDEHTHVCDKTCITTLVSENKIIASRVITEVGAKYYVN